MDFEEYMTTTGMEEQTENSCAWEFYKELYKVGQQSKQSEIDELRKRIDEVIYDLQHIESAMWEEQVEHVLMILKGEHTK